MQNIATKHTTVSSFKKEYDLENIETAMQIYAPLENYVEDAQQQKILELFEVMLFEKINFYIVLILLMQDLQSKQ